MPPTPARTGRTPGRRPATVDIDLTLLAAEPDDPDDYDSWHAVWSLRESSTGTEFSSDDLAEVVESVVRDCRQRFASRYQVQMHWHLDPGEPAAAVAVTATGIDLPTTLV